ncbi:MAG: carbohydrate ABC transporter permease [Gemmiger sp.]|nr:carbohydrate ABC transporter permease [Gemmiger sp.]
MQTKLREKIFLRWLPLVVINIYVLVPILWTVITSLKAEGDILKKPIRYLPNPATIENYLRAWVNCNFSKYFLNSMFISVVSVSAIVLIAIMVGYALNRFQFRGRTAFMLLLLCIQFIPHAVLLIPLFNTFHAMNLIGKPLAVILVCITFQFPFNSILMRGFISGIPYTLEEAAQIDGCNRFQAVLKVVIPVLVPGIVTTAAFAFIGVWNEFLFSMMFLNDAANYTIPIGLKMMQGEYNISYGALAAGAIIAMSIPVALFAYLQKYLVTGLSAGAVKG